MVAVKQGYKNTEVGVIPENWEVKSYGEIFRFLNSATYSRAELCDNAEIKYIHYGDIHTKWDFYLDFKKHTLPTIKNEQLKNYSIIQNGDVIMADASEDYIGIGKSIEIFNIEQDKVIAGLHTFLLRDINDNFVNGYRAYIHSIGIVKKQFDSLATGMKVYGVSKNNLKQVLIPIPTLAEQTAIANALSDADNYITSLEKLIAKKRLIKQGAMQELLKPKEDWEVKKLGDIFLISAGGDLDIAKFSIIQDDKYSYPIYSNALTNKGLYGFTSEYKQIENTITVTARGQIGVAVPRNHKFTAIGRVIILMPIVEVNINFISEFINNYIVFNNESTGVPQLTAPQISKHEINMPNYEEQTRIATILSDMDNEITVLESKLEKARQIKQGMMQELLTGKIRLKNS